MDIRWVLAPVFIQVALTFILLFWMGSVRVAALRGGMVKVRDIALGQSAWPEREMQISNAFHNQLQLPMLFYVVVLLAIILRKTDFLFAVLAWVFVALRIVHAAIHVTSNHVPRRFYVFVASAVVLMLMWIIVAFRILSGT